jgi:two-component system KDP operon response regulator KdpE
MPQNRILIVDDDVTILKALRLSFIAAGYAVVTAGTAAEAAAALRADAVHAIILDLGLPDRDGKTLIPEIRQQGDVPIIVLSARHVEGEKIAALDAGANDYVDKPFSTGELLARLRVALRLRQNSDAARSYQTANLSIDLAARRVLVRGREVRLTPKEFDLLRVLAQHAGQVVTRNQLLEFVWGASEKRDSQVLRVLVGQLRQKIEADPRMPAMLLTEPGIGYRLQAEDDVA